MRKSDVKYKARKNTKPFGRPRDRWKNNEGF
jgi:hypothetical protein